MNRSTSYKTKQKEELLSYLKDHAGSHVRANDIYEDFKKQNKRIGLTTIYRHLDTLVEDGLVQKCFVDGIAGACYEFLGDENDHDDSFHLKCEVCGKLISFQCKELEHVKSHLLKDHGFMIDSPKTILYGTCKSCSHK